MIRAATGAKREIYCRSICLAFTVDIITANVSPLWKSSRPRRSILRQFYCHRRHQGPLRPETYSPSLKFSAPNMLGNPFYGAHLKTNGRWHQILNPVSSDTAPPTCLWTLVQMSLGKGVGWGEGGLGVASFEKVWGKRISRRWGGICAQQAHNVKTDGAGTVERAAGTKNWKNLNKKCLRSNNLCNLMTLCTISGTPLFPSND